MVPPHAERPGRDAQILGTVIFRRLYWPDERRSIGVYGRICTRRDRI